MNYLSHLYLSQRTPESLTGNMMGDFKPDSALKARLPNAILLGIENHRFVDRLTDRYQPVKELRTLFSPERRRFSGIVTDIAFDYFLIKHWDSSKDGRLEDFINDCYSGLAACEELMPPRMALVTSKMREHNWLSQYATIAGIGHSIDQVSRRLRFPNQMAGAIEEVEYNYDQIERVFLALFTHLRAEISRAAIESQQSPS